MEHESSQISLTFGSKKVFFFRRRQAKVALLLLNLGEEEPSGSCPKASPSRGGPWKEHCSKRIRKPPKFPDDSRVLMSTQEPSEAVTGSRSRVLK